MTSITVLGGTGQQGSGLARRFARAGIGVIVGSRDPDRARATMAGWGATRERIEVATNAAAAAQATVVVLAVPFGGVDALI
jgi:predicted dinucleotide-binding enzyme